MVAVQVLLMNYFLLGLHTDQHISNDVLLPGDAVGVGGECSYGCTQCSPVNGCLACKSPFFLLLHRDETRQFAVCTRSCPRGYYKLKRKNKRGFCAKCMLRGCRECSTRHYCSVCKTGLVRHAGRCRKRCPEGTLLSARSPGLCLSAPESIPDAAPNEIEVNTTTSSQTPSRRRPRPQEPSVGTRRPQRPPDQPPPHHHPQGVPREPPQHPNNQPTVTELEAPHENFPFDPQVLYPELPINSTTSSDTTLNRRKNKKKRKKKRKKEKDKRRHEKSRRRKERERRRRKRLRNKERRKKKQSRRQQSTTTTISPVVATSS